MPAPYTDAEQDALIDQLLADTAALTTRVDTLETDLAALTDRVDTIEAALVIIEPQVTDLLTRTGTLETDSETHGANISTLQGRASALETDVGTLQTDVADLQSRVDSIEGVSVPAVDTLQEDVSTLKVSARKRQETDTDHLGSAQIVTRPSLERVKRPDGRIVQRVARPR